MARTKKIKKEATIERLEGITEKVSEQNNDTFEFDTGGELVVDVFETDSEFVVLTAIAGVQIKDLDISVQKDMMIIRGNRQNPHVDPKKRYFYQECYFGPFSRKIVLPENIHTQKALAEMDKGLLIIKIPKIMDSEKGEIETKNA